MRRDIEYTLDKLNEDIMDVDEVVRSITEEIKRKLRVVRITLYVLVVIVALLVAYKMYVLLNLIKGV